jgi:hypothetical protein
MGIAEIRAMSQVERLRTMEMLWGVLCEDESELESPEWHEAILSKRRQRIESGEAEFLSIDQLKARFSS